MDKHDAGKEAEVPLEDDSTIALGNPDGKDGGKGDQALDAHSPSETEGAGANPDPEAQRVTGLNQGGGVPPGETPPASDQMGGDQGHDE